jgi:hypothetical protein
VSWPPESSRLARPRARTSPSYLVPQRRRQNCGACHAAYLTDRETDRRRLPAGAAQPHSPTTPARSTTEYGGTEYGGLPLEGAGQVGETPWMVFATRADQQRRSPSRRASPATATVGHPYRLTEARRDRDDPAVMAKAWYDNASALQPVPSGSGHRRVHARSGGRTWAPATNGHSARDLPMGEKCYRRTPAGVQGTWRGIWPSQCRSEPEFPDVSRSRCVVVDPKRSHR